MKIGIDASRYQHEKATGVEWYSWHIINEILKLNQEDEIFLYSKKPLKLSGVKNIVIKQKKFWTLFGLSREILKDKPDVLFVPSHTLPLILPKKSVITIHDIAFKYLKSSYSLLHYLYLNWSTRFAVKKATKIIVPSEATAEDLVKFYKCPTEKIEVIPHGYTPREHVDESQVKKTSPIFRHFKIDAKMKYFLYVGRLETKKNLVRLVEAFEKFSQDNPEFRLILAGKRGHGFKKLLDKVNQLELMDKVIMPGYITEEEKAVLYKNCKAFVFPSLYEGFGLPILEAFYYSKPVLTSWVSSMPEVGGKAAVYIDPYNISEIVEGLEKVIEMDGTKNKEELEKFSWSRAAKQTLKVIHEQ